MEFIGSYVDTDDDDDDDDSPITAKDAWSWCCRIGVHVQATGVDGVCFFWLSLRAGWNLVERWCCLLHDLNPSPPPTPPGCVGHSSEQHGLQR